MLVRTIFRGAGVDGNEERLEVGSPRLGMAPAAQSQKISAVGVGAGEVPKVCHNPNSKK